MARKFALGKAPFQRITDERRLSTSQMMRDFVIALIPLILFGWLKNGLLPFIKYNGDPIMGISFMEMIYPLLFIIVGGLTSVVSETLFFYFTGKHTWAEIRHELSLSYAVIPGLLLAMMLPVYTPIWVLMLGCFAANIVFKMLFGGFGHNVLNPALMGYVFITTAFISVITASIRGGYLLPSELFESSATPLTNMVGKVGGTYKDLVEPYGNLLKMFLGFRPGSLAETSGLLCILACVYLIVRRVIVWIIPVVYVGTVFVLTLIIGVVNGQGLWFPVFNVLSGGLLFGAVFMATEPVTSPKSPNGKVIYAFLLGVLTTLFRLSGNLPEGVATSILFMNLFVPIIERFAASARASVAKRNVTLKYVGVALFITLLAAYTVYRVTDIANPDEENGEEFEDAPIVEVIE